jgi:serine/threonine protein kinase
VDDLIGPYRLERRLGSGGMGEVHLARGPDGKRVAIKVMHAQWSTLAEYRERFRSEVELARRVARFCTAAVLDASFDEPFYLVTEYVEGNTLAETVERDGALDGGQLESVAIGTAVALSAIHRVGIIHRDLKPSNIILSPYGPKVIDFGIAQLENVIGRSGPLVVGTLSVIAPERLAGQRASTASDVFSWGCVVAYAGTGRWPFGGGTSTEMLYRIMHLQPDLDGLDERLLPLVWAALDKDPAARPSVHGLLEEMTGLGLQLAGPVTQPTKPPTKPPREWRNRWRNRWRRGWRSTHRVVTALALGTAAIVLITVAVFLLRSRPPAFHVVRDDDFSGRYWWPELQSTGPNSPTAQLAGGHYRLNVANPLRVPDQGGLPAPADVDTSRYADVIVTARASGTGAYGVWCRGNPPHQPTAKYEFYVSGTGEAAIVKRAPDGSHTDLRPFGHAFTPTSTNRVQARCQSVRNGVRLSLTVNDRRVATATDALGPLGPGAVGVIAYARDVAQASADFDSFTIETP